MCFFSSTTIDNISGIEYFELEEEDVILMPEGVSHTLINVGKETAVVTWSMAPPENGEK